MVNRFGFWSAAAAAAASLCYAVPQLLQVAGLLPDPWDRMLIFAPSLALAPAFVLTLVAAHTNAAPEHRIWTLSALSLGILYAADVSQVYVVQLGAVIPTERAGDLRTLSLAECCGWHRPATAVDLLGYTYMCLSMLLLAPAFPGGGVRRWLRRALIANGALGPFIFAQLAWPRLIYVGAAWLVTFPAAMILLARVFAAVPPGDFGTIPASSIRRAS
jgi:hypothetical protein